MLVLTSLRSLVVLQVDVFLLMGTGDWPVSVGSTLWRYGSAVTSLPLLLTDPVHSGHMTSVCYLSNSIHPSILIRGRVLGAADPAG